MSLKKLGGETLIYGLSSILGRALNYVFAQLFISFVMSNAEFGTVGDLMFWTGLFIALLVFRMDTAVFRFASRREYDQAAVFRKALRWVVGFSLLGAAVALPLAGELAGRLGYPDRAIYVQLVVVIVALDAMSAVPLARVRLEQRPWFFMVVNLGNVLVNVVLIYLLLWAWPRSADWASARLGVDFLENYKVAYYLTALAVAAAFRFVLLLVDGWRRYGKAAGAVRAPSWRTMLGYSAPLALVSVAGVINFMVGPTIIKGYFGGDTVSNLSFSGEFSAAMKMAVLLNLFVYAYNYAAEPFFFREQGKDPNRTDRRIFADAARAYALVAALASAGILLFLPWLRFIIDEGERQGLYVLPVLLGVNFLFGLYANLSVAYKLTDKTLYGGVISVIGGVIVVGGSVAFLADYGTWAVAFSMLAGLGVMCSLAYGVSRRFFPVAYPWGRIGGYVLLAGTVTAAVWGTEVFWVRTLAFLALVGALAAMEWRWVRGILQQR